MKLHRAVSIITTALVFVAPLSASAAQVDAVWNVGSGNWNAGANWLPAVVPNNGTGGNTYHVKIDNGAGTNAVAAMNLSPTIDLLSISAGDTLNINAFQTLSVATGPIVNDGLIAWNATFGSTNTGLLLASPMSLEGSGVIQIGNLGINRILGVTGGTPPHLTHAATHTVRGGGTFGGDTLTLTNNGLIEADTGLTMNLDLAVGANVNAGTLQAIGTGALNINGTVLDNTAGTIKALNTATVNINSSSIVGGTLLTDLGAAISGTASTLQNITLNGLLRHDNAEDLTYQGTITNNGTIQLNGTGSGADKTDFVVASSGTTLAGPGAIEGNNHANQANYITAVASPTPPLLVNTATHTIRGSLHLGNNGINLTNQGLIEANNAVPINLDCAAGANVNTGTIQASGAGTLNIIGTDLDNTAGFIKALGTSTININSSTIIGGPLQADPTAAFSGNASTLQNITLNGLLRHDNTEDLTYKGTIVNNGTIQLNGTGSGADKTDFVVSPSGATLAGPGALEGNNHVNQANYITAVASPTPPLLVNTATHTIRGSLHLGNNGINLTNQGLIEANNAVPINLDCAAGANVNTGTIQASGAGTLNITGTDLDNTAGFIKALGTSTVNINNSTITGGPLQADPTAAFSGNGATLKDVSLTGLLRHDNTESLTYEGTIINNGLIQLNGTSSGATKTNFIASPSGVTVNGTGAIELNNNANQANFVTAVVAPTLPLLVNGVGHTIRGAGNLGANVLHITNNGTLLANQSLPMVIDPPSDGQGFLNNGTINVETQLNIAVGNFTNAGTVNIPAGAALNRTGIYTQSGGTTTVNGTLTPLFHVEINGGTLAGNGTVNSEVINSGTIAPGDGVGTLMLTGGFQTTGIISIEIAGLTQHDFLDTAPDTFTQVGGTLRVRFVNGFEPQVGDVFNVISYADPVSVPGAQSGGDFTSIDVPCDLSGRRVEVIHSQPCSFCVGGGVIVRIVAADDFVDVNCDCAYAFPGDIQALIQAMLDPAAYDAQYPGCTQADVNGDGQRNGKDVQAFVNALLN